MAAITLAGRFPRLQSVGTTQLDVSITDWDRLYSVHHTGKSSTGGASTVDVFCLLDNTTGTVATNYNSSDGAGKAVLQTGNVIPIPYGIKTAQFKTASGTGALQFLAGIKGNHITT